MRSPWCWIDPSRYKITSRSWRKRTCVEAKSGSIGGILGGLGGAWGGYEAPSSSRREEQRAKSAPAATSSIGPAKPRGRLWYTPCELDSWIPAFV